MAGQPLVADDHYRAAVIIVALGQAHDPGAVLRFALRSTPFG
jgi:hypothetical protein